MEGVGGEGSTLGFLEGGRWEVRGVTLRRVLEGGLELPPISWNWGWGRVLKSSQSSNPSFSLRFGIHRLGFASTSGFLLRVLSEEPSSG